MPTMRPPCSTASGVTVTSTAAPPRSTANTIGTPALALVMAATSAGERTGLPSTAAMRSPAASPARSPGLPATSSAIRGVPRSARRPSVASALPSQSAGCSRPIASTRVTGGSPARGPAGSTASATASRPWALVSRQRRSCQLRTGSPSSATTRSPARRPAAAAAVPDAGSASSARWPGMPAMYVPANSTTASSRLAAGPAATMAMRFHTLWRLNARARSAGGTSPSRSSAIFT